MHSKELAAGYTLVIQKIEEDRGIGYKNLLLFIQNFTSPSMCRKSITHTKFCKHWGGGDSIYN